MLHKNGLVQLAIFLSIATSSFVFAEVKSTTKNNETQKVKKIESSISQKDLNDSMLKFDVDAGYFNSALAVSQSKTGKELSESIEKKRTGFTEEFKKSEAEYTKKVKDLQAKASILPVESRERLEAEALKMKRDIENKAKSYEEELKLAMHQAQERVLRELADAVYECGRKAGKDVMVDVATSRVYIINPDKLSGTSSIVEVMNKSYDKKLVASKEKSSTQKSTVTA